MSPAPGERLVRFVGDHLVFQLRAAHTTPPPPGWRALLRTNLGRSAALLQDILCSHATGAPAAGESWRDIPMRPDATGWSLTLPLAEVGFFKAKAYALDERGWQHWPAGPDFGVSVQPNFARTANTLYCAFPRLFGATRSLPKLADADLAEHIQPLADRDYSVIPPSGKLRDLIPLLPHIVGDLRCRILHLLPISPTPTTFARFGRYGSPYAALDLAAIDPALVVFDKRTTGVDQFKELAYATHALGARLFLDIVINHTGWGSTLFEQHPDWFERRPDGEFHRPGAWGNTWEDLVELKHDNVALWDEIADSLLTWCRRGVDGFRCDAGYMVPLPAWQYIIARVRQEFPDALFLLEGLGGAWEATAALLGEGGMQWAYSELFQNHSPVQVSGYLDHAWRQSEQAGPLIHYSETHDNSRLAAHDEDPRRARQWSLLRNRLCALASVNGGFGFTGGVEWLATEKINVHDCTGLNWGAPEHLIKEIQTLNHLLATHPAFFDGAKLTRLSQPDAPVLAFLRESAEGQDAVLVLVNLDLDATQSSALHSASPVPGRAELLLGPGIQAAQQHRPPDGGWHFELLGQALPENSTKTDGQVTFKLLPGAAYCLAPTAQPRGLSGEDYRHARARAAWALQALQSVVPVEAVADWDWLGSASQVNRSPQDFLIGLQHLAVGNRLVPGDDQDDQVVDRLVQVDDLDVPVVNQNAGVINLHVPVNDLIVPIDDRSLKVGVEPAQAGQQAGQNDGQTAPIDDRNVPIYDLDVLNDDPKQLVGDRNAGVDNLNAGIDDKNAGIDNQIELAASRPYPNVIRWTLADVRRVTVVPPGHWLLIEDEQPFRAELETREAEQPAVARMHVESFRAAGKYFASFPPRTLPAEATLRLERYADSDRQVTAQVRFLAAQAGLQPVRRQRRPGDLALLTNGRGGMARLRVDLGRIESKYDCALAANLHPTLPVDRHVFVKRVRVWVNADGFIAPLDFHNLRSFEAGPPALWRFAAHAGDGRTVEVQLAVDMLPERNTSVFCFTRPSVAEATGKQLPDDAEVRLVVRVDLEDRNFHNETHRNGGAEHHFGAHTRPSKRSVGFTFTPAADRHLHVFANVGEFHAQPEWSEGIAHPIEASRGQTASGDAWSPGWFELPLRKGTSVGVVLCADPSDPSEGEISAFKARVRKWGGGCVDGPRPSQPPLSLSFIQNGGKGWGEEARCVEPGTVSCRQPGHPLSPALSPAPSGGEGGVISTAFVAQLTRAAQAFVVRREEGKTIVAGYPWFLDWGRDTLICARGLLAAGMTETVREILLTFARYEDLGTLPNIIHGEHVGNRDTSDAPLWFAVVAEEWARGEMTNDEGRMAKEARMAKPDEKLAQGDVPSDFGPSDLILHSSFVIRHFSTVLPGTQRTLADVLASIARHYLLGTPNGIRVDAASGLVWSPAHFTWMDTNHPAGTPREGYPIEIQCLWIRLLRLLAWLDVPAVAEPWSVLAQRAHASLEALFWVEEQGWFADVLLAPAGTPAANAVPDDALRSNCLFAISLGLVSGERARRCVEAARHWLVVPGGLRTLAPLPVSVPLAVRTTDGHLLNDPAQPYWGRYEGDEDTRRKPAYHNGTAWTLTFPVFCEALARAWDFSPKAVAAARAYLGSMARLSQEGCVGQLPEILDGDAPHTQRGCDAQAWGVTEALRVARLLG